MNCKPGDIAVSVGCRNSGRMMKVLYAAPYTRFILPNGRPHQAAASPCWVVELIDGPMRVGLTNGGTRLVTLGVAEDRAIRPLRDPDEAEQIDDELCCELTSTVKHE